MLFILLACLRLPGYHNPSLPIMPNLNGNDDTPSSGNSVHVSVAQWCSCLCFRVMIVHLVRRCFPHGPCLLSGALARLVSDGRSPALTVTVLALPHTPRGDGVTGTFHRDARQGRDRPQSQLGITPAEHKHAPDCVCLFIVL